MANTKAPFKRGQKLMYTCCRCNMPKRVAKKHEVEVTYVKWWGIMRSSLIVVRGPDGTTRTVHVNDVRPV